MHATVDFNGDTLAWAVGKVPGHYTMVVIHHSKIKQASSAMLGGCRLCLGNILLLPLQSQTRFRDRKTVTQPLGNAGN